MTHSGVCHVDDLHVEIERQWVLLFIRDIDFCIACSCAFKYSAKWPIFNIFSNIVIYRLVISEK